MKNAEIEPDEDDLRAEYDDSVLKGGVRAKYLDRYRAGTNLALLAQISVQRFQRMNLLTKHCGRSSRVRVRLSLNRPPSSQRTDLS